MPNVPTRFRVYIGLLANTSGSIPSWNEYTDVLMDSQLEIAQGLASKTTLFDFEAQNITLTLWGDFRYPANDTFVTIRPYSPVRIDVVGNNYVSRTVFRGYVSADGVTCDEEFEDMPISKILVVSYSASLKDVVLGTYDNTYRLQSYGQTDLDPNEAFCLYIKGGSWDVPGVTDPTHPAVNNAEVALTPTQFHLPNLLIPGDRFLFERRFLFDSRMLTEGVFYHTSDDDDYTGWHSYTYNGNPAAIRYLEQEDPFHVTIYTRPAVSLTTVLDHLCLRMNLHWFQFTNFHSEWPHWSHPYNASNPPPNLLVPGKIPLSVARCWHFRYLRVQNLDWLIVWHTQFQAEVFLVTNNSVCESFGTYDFSSYMQLVRHDFWAHFLDIWFGDTRIRLHQSWGSPQRRNAVDGEDTLRAIHPDWETWNNVFDVVGDRYIIFGNLRSVRFWIHGGTAENEYDNVTNAEIVVFDCQERRLVSNGTMANYGAPSDEFGDERGAQIQNHPAIQFVMGGSDYYHIPFHCTAADPTSQTNGAWQTENWQTAIQHVNSAPEVGDTNYQRLAAWTDGETVNGSPSIVESSPINEYAIGSSEGASYTREFLELTFVGDIALDHISFAFEDMTCADLLKLLCTLSDSIPVFDHSQPGEMRLSLIPRQVQSSTTRVFNVSDLMTPLSTEQFSYISSDSAPQIDFPSLEISEQQKKALNRTYQDRYFLSKHELVTCKLSFLEDVNGMPPVSWLVDAKIGETLILNGRNGVMQTLGMIERIAMNDYEVTLVARRRF